MDIDKELEQIKKSLLPLEFNDVLLDEGYVPKVPQVKNIEKDANNLIRTFSNRDNLLKEKNIYEVKIPKNRLSGVIYAARFFVTRVGFLRHVKRIMVLSSNHLTILDLHSDDIKEQYAYDEIKEINISADSAGVQGDRAFTLVVGKNVKDTYTCRSRQYFLSAYYQLRERASLASAEQMNINSEQSDVASTLGLEIGRDGKTSSFGSSTSFVGSAPTPIGTMDTLNTNGAYFDNLFQLVGVTFTVMKWSRIEAKKKTVNIAVRASSLDLLDDSKKETVSSTLLIDIVKIQRVTSNSNEMLVFFENSRVHRYWTDSREPFIQVIGNNLRSWLGTTLFVQDVNDAGEYEALISTQDIPQPVAFEIPVLKISKKDDTKLNLRLLALTSTNVLERDPITRRTLSSHSLSDIFNVVIYPSVSSSNEEAETTNGSRGMFALELKNGRTRRYFCLKSTVSCRNKEIGVGLKYLTRVDEEELKNAIGDIGKDNSSTPSWLMVAGATTILSAKEARSLLVCNMMEMCRMNKFHLLWSTEETKICCKEGTWGTDVHPELEEVFLRKLVSINLTPNHVTNDDLNRVFRQLEQYNRNAPVGGARQRDRRAFAAAMKLLVNFKEYTVSQLNSPSNWDSPIPPTEFQVALLLTIQRLLCTRGIFEEVPQSQYKKAILIVVELLYSPCEEVAFAAASVLKHMVISYCDNRSMKSEGANRRAIFTKYNCKLFVSRAFDVTKYKSIERRIPESHSPHSVQARLIIDNIDKFNDEVGQAKALISMRIGLDYLVISLVLQTLEVCLSSGKKSTSERITKELLKAMHVDNFMRHHALFMFNRSLSFAISKCSSILVKVHVLEQPSELVELIQDFARRHGALIWQMYLSLYAQDKTQRRISSQLVALLTHENPRTSHVIRQMFPHALLDDIPITELEYDEFGRLIPHESVAKVKHLKTGLQIDSHHNKKGVHATDSGRKGKFGITTRARLIQNTKNVVLLPEFFDRVWKTISIKDLIWSPAVVEELIHKLELEVALLDLHRLRYQCYLYTDPLAFNHSDFDVSLLESTDFLNYHDLSAIFQDEKSSAFHRIGSAMHVLASNEALSNSAASSNRFAGFMPISFLVNPNSSEDRESDGELQSPSIDDSGILDSDEISNEETDLDLDSQGDVSHHDATLKSSENIAGSTTTKKQREKIKMKNTTKDIPNWYVAWNSDTFSVEYLTLKDEIKVGAYYLTNLLNDRGILVEDIEDPERFMTLLYYRLLVEEESSDNFPPTASSSSLESFDVDQSDVRLLVLKVMIQVYERHYLQLNTLYFLNHLVRVSMIQGGMNSTADKQWPLVVRGNIVLFLDRVLSSAVNAARFLQLEQNVEVILELLREVKPLVHSQESDVADVDNIDFDYSDMHGSPPKEYALHQHGDDGEEDDDEDDDDDDDDYGDVDDDDFEEANEGHDGEFFAAPRSSLSMISHNGQPIHFTVVAEHSGSMSASMIMQTCLSILCRLVECQTAEDEGIIQYDVKFPKYGRITRFAGSAVSPVSGIKKRLCEDQTLRFLVGLLDCSNRSVFKKCLILIRLLARHNEAIIPSLHSTGLFYYLIRFAKNSEEMTVAARLISYIHLRQSRQAIIHLEEKTQSGQNEKGVFSPDPLTQICLKSWLVRLLPVSMVAQLLRHGPKRFAEAFFSDSSNPEVVWNEEMRSQLVSYMEKFMALHLDGNKMFYISAEHDHDHETSIALIEYPKEVHALQCYQYYLQNLLDEEHFPDWPINDVPAFLSALIDCINRWSHPERFQTERKSIVDTKLLSIADAVQLLNATALLLRRFPNTPSISNFRGLVHILEAQDKCIGDLQNTIATNEHVLDLEYGDVTSKLSLVLALESAVRVVNRAVSMSDANAHECSSGLGLRVLCGSLQFLFRNNDALEKFETFHYRESIHLTLDSLVKVLKHQNGRVSAAAQSLDFVPCLTRFLTIVNDPIATNLSLHIIHEMAGSCGEMAEVLLLQLAEHGVLWYLTNLVLLHPNPSASKATADSSQNKLLDESEIEGIRLAAARALARIYIATAKEESIAIFVQRMQLTISSIFTRPLVDLLLNEQNGPEKFLHVFAKYIQEPHIMWTPSMREQLTEITSKAIDFHAKLDLGGRNAHEVFEIPSNFVYNAQQEELCVAGIYVNFFNENPRASIHAQISGIAPSPIFNSLADQAVVKNKLKAGRKTSASPIQAETGQLSVPDRVMHGLLTALSYDMTNVRAQPNILQNVLMQRMLPEATAIRHLIQYTADMDRQVVLSNGILILLSVLDHEAQPNAFSFTCAPLLQLRCIECLHMLCFSGNCVDALAALVPSFVTAAFQVVYENLAKSEATIEGQLARITLQLLGNLCLVPACIDNLVKGMDPFRLSQILPQAWNGESNDVQLLLCLHMIPLKRHTQGATQFTKEAVQSQLAATLLDLLSTIPQTNSHLAPSKTKQTAIAQTKSYVARFLSVLSSNPGSGGAISSLLIASRVWETHGDSTQGSSDDLRRLLICPDAPELLKADQSNFQKLGR